jgi:hypothetical protein
VRAKRLRWRTASDGGPYKPKRTQEKSQAPRLENNGGHPRNPRTHTQQRRVRHPRARRTPSAVREAQDKEAAPTKQEQGKLAQLLRVKSGKGKKTSVTGVTRLLQIETEMLNISELRQKGFAILRFLRDFS